MSITPMTTASTVAPATSTGEAGAAEGGPADGTFAALVSSLLGEGQPTPAGTGAAEAVVVPPVVSEGETVEPTAAEGTPAAGDEQVVAPVATPLWATLATPLVPTPVTAAPSGLPSADESVDSGTVAAEGTVAGDPLATARAQTQSTSTTATPAVVAAAGQPGLPGTDQGAAVEGPSTSTPGSTTDVAAPASADTSQREPGDQPPAAAAPARASENEAAPAPAPAPTGVAPAAAASAPATTPTTTSGTDAARPVPVVSQLAPEVTRMVSRGNGVHHVTMLLQPEALGEVRVTLTVRNGEVLVRLAAGDDAQRALLEGAPELRRVLELAGTGDARVVVRDLPSATPGSQQGWPSPERSAHPDSSGAFGSGGDTNASGRGRTDDQDQHARTRGGSTARDGLTDGAHPLRPNPVTDASRGIDLTM
ncbi:flagellar hook-length control protein FliK [Nocardioides seonyuensis]|uniref:Flagellar hook-length control protein FliK n=1 Tax=Nocardioides seonyuensis TaxID=2518371 RepID=A0A4P7IGN5_9ACTN|nr:flagellar hook-length control protein FliK [Nocardioides seonyuensis]QBX55237.1 flagellar hook-length control protein FliK [Nocardioides seonyuensis]